jgi:hypothetical protein
MSPLSVHAGKMSFCVLFCPPASRRCPESVLSCPLAVRTCRHPSFLSVSVRSTSKKTRELSKGLKPEPFWGLDCRNEKYNRKVPIIRTSWRESDKTLRVSPDSRRLPSGGAQSASFGLLSLKMIYGFALSGSLRMSHGLRTEQPKTCYNA